MAKPRPRLHVVGVALPLWFVASDSSFSSSSRAHRTHDSPDAQGESRRLADASVVASIRAGDPDIFRKLYTDLYAELADFALAMTRSRDLAEDAVQLAMTRLWIGRERFAPVTSVRAYLFTAVRRNVFEILRRDKHIATAEEQAADIMFTWVPMPDADVEARELSQKIGHAVAALPARAREVFLLSRRFALSHQEIATILGISINTVSNHMGRALQGIAAVVE